MSKPPKRSVYEIVEYDLPPLKDDELLLETLWVSVDPYLRTYNKRNKAPYDQFSFQVAEVQESKNLKYPVGSKVITHNGWYDYSVIKESDEQAVGMPKVIL